MSMEHDERPLARRLVWAFLAPLVLLVAAGSVLALQVSRASEDASWVDHTDEVIAKSYEVQKQFLDQETGLRGYILTGDRRFLEPYQQAHPREVIRELLRLVADNAEQHTQVERVRERYESWFEQAAFVDKPGALEAYRSAESMAT